MPRTQTKVLVVSPQELAEIERCIKCTKSVQKYPNRLQISLLKKLDKEKAA